MDEWDTQLKGSDECKDGLLVGQADGCIVIRSVTIH